LRRASHRGTAEVISGARAEAASRPYLKMEDEVCVEAVVVAPPHSELLTVQTSEAC
jgi:hypothetical protein